MTNTPSCDNCGEYPGHVVSEEIESLRAALIDIAHGNGMFGLDAQADLAWAMEHAAKAIKQNEGRDDG